MSRRFARRALSWPELMLIVAIIAFMIAILLPSLSRARQQGKKAVCLSNLKSQAMASHVYAIEDARELLMPIHPRMVAASDRWQWNTVHGFAQAGASATEPFQTFAGEVVFLNEKPGQGGGTIGEMYAAKHRPLNKYVCGGDIEGMQPDDFKLFHCPGDVGYPDASWVKRSPRANAGKWCYTTLGSSYRANLHALYRDNGEALSLGPWGQRASGLFRPSQCVLIADALFYEMAYLRPDDADLPDSARGWHGKQWHENAAFADGAAASVNVDPRNRAPLNLPQAEDLEGSKNSALLVRDIRWSLDAYPAPGARIWGKWKTPADFAQFDQAQWPFAKMRDNLHVPN